MHGNETKNLAIAKGRAICIR